MVRAMRFHRGLGGWGEGGAGEEARGLGGVGGGRQSHSRH